MGKVIVYIATSLDGYIARSNDDVSWLEAYNAGGEDYGYKEFMKTVGTVIIGARSYAQSLLHPERMIHGIRNYILSKTPMALFPGVETIFYEGDLSSLVRNIKKESDKDIYVLGGGRVVSSFLKAGFVEELIQFIAPVLIREGIPLYPDLDRDIYLKLTAAIPYKSGIVELRYVPALL